MSVAIVDGAAPIRNSSVIGVRYAIVGMICITSRNGDRKALSRSLRPATMPERQADRDRDDDRGEDERQGRHAGVPQADGAESHEPGDDDESSPASR